MIRMRFISAAVCFAPLAFQFLARQSFGISNITQILSRGKTDCLAFQGMAFHIRFHHIFLRRLTIAT